MKVELTKGYVVLACLGGDILGIFDTRKSAENYIGSNKKDFMITECDIILHDEKRASVVKIGHPYEYGSFEITDNMILEKIRVAALNKLTTQEIEVLGLKR